MGYGCVNNRAPLSPRAQRTWDKLRKGNKFYPVQFPEPGPVIKELIDKGYVMTGGRVARIVSCYVPCGTTPLTREQFPEEK